MSEPDVPRDRGGDRVIAIEDARVRLNATNAWSGCLPADWIGVAASGVP